MLPFNFRILEPLVYNMFWPTMSRQFCAYVWPFLCSS